MKIYEENGFTIGENLVFSMEAENRPLIIKQLEAKIEKYLI